MTGSPTRRNDPSAQCLIANASASSGSMRSSTRHVHHHACSVAEPNEVVGHVRAGLAVLLPTSAATAARTTPRRQGRNPRPSPGPARARTRNPWSAIVLDHHRPEKLRLPRYEPNCRTGRTRSNGTIEHDDSDSARRRPPRSTSDTLKSADSGTRPNASEPPTQQLQPGSPRTRRGSR